jgi:crotonobetainyl-CoA:carnitine CoA-transferase CaiB-like acyl-CoA transferase
MIELLKGIRVLECAVLPTGDNAGRLLGDMGAEVIKIEQPGVGDYIRVLGGQFAPDHSYTHMVVNRNKRSLTLNLRTDEGRRILYEILPSIDIFVDGFAADACARLGVGYEDQRKVKPNIIYLQVNGLGAKGPYSRMPMHGYQMGALAGATKFRVRDDGLAQEFLPVDERNFPGYPDAPLMGALYGAFTAVSALNYRTATGKGIYIDASATDATLAVQQLDATAEWNKARIKYDANVIPKVGQDPRERPKYCAYLTKDNKLIHLGTIEQKFWVNLCRAIERPDLGSVHYTDSPVDFRNVGGRSDLANELKAVFATRTLADWMDIAIDNDIPMTPANTLEEASLDPHLSARQMVHKSVHPVAGPYSTVGWPALVSDQPFDIQLQAPTLGQHTDEILARLGYSAERIAALRESQDV